MTVHQMVLREFILTFELIFAVHDPPTLPILHSIVYLSPKL